MKDFTASLPFIITFMSVTLLLQLFAGEQLAYYFLLLVLFSMIVINADKFNTFIRRIASYGR